MKSQNKTISKGRMLLILGVAVVALGSTFVTANIIMSKKSQLSNVTNVLGVATNQYYDVSIDNAVLESVDKQNPPTSKRYNVALSIKNKDSQVLQIIPGKQIFLTTNTGNTYLLTTKFLTPGMVMGGPVLSGGTSKLSLDFDIPTNETPKQLVFQADGTKPVVAIAL